MFNKKADVEIATHTIFMIIAVLLVAGVVAVNTFKITTGDNYKLRAGAVDFGLAVDAVFSLPYDTNVVETFYFPFPVELKINPKIVQLKAKNLESEFYFNEDPKIKTEYINFDDIGSVYIVRNGDTLSFSKDEPNNIGLNICPDKKLNLKKVVFDPGKGWNKDKQEGTQGKIINSVPESVLTLMIAASLDPKVFESTRNIGAKLKDSSLSVVERQLKMKNADALVSVHVGDTENLIKAYVFPNEDSMALACSILNELIKKLNPENSSIIPVNFKLVPFVDYKQVLNLFDKKPAVLFEIGNEVDKFILKKEVIAEAIEQGVKNA